MLGIVLSWHTPNQTIKIFNQTNKKNIINKKLQEWGGSLCSSIQFICICQILEGVEDSLTWFYLQIRIHAYQLKLNKIRQCNIIEILIV